MTTRKQSFIFLIISLLHFEVCGLDGVNSKKLQQRIEVYLADHEIRPFRSIKNGDDDFKNLKLENYKIKWVKNRKFNGIKINETLISFKNKVTQNFVENDHKIKIAEYANHIEHTQLFEANAGKCSAGEAGV